MDDAFEKEEDELVVLLDYCLAHDIISNRHVAYQNLFRLLVCALNLQSKAPPNAFRELMNFDYERCNKFGLAAAEFEVGAGCSGNQQHHIDPKTLLGCTTLVLILSDNCADFGLPQTTSQELTCLCSLISVAGCNNLQPRHVWPSEKSKVCLEH